MSETAGQPAGAENGSLEKSFLEMGIFKKPELLTPAIIGEPDQVIHDMNGESFGIYRVGPEERFHIRVAREICRQTHEDGGVVTMTDHLSKFSSPRKVREFPEEKQRHVSVLVGQSGDYDSRLAGLAWMRRLMMDDMKDAVIAAYCDDPDTAGTLSSAIYEPHRGRKLFDPFVTDVIYEYFKGDEDCKEIVIQVNLNDANAIGALEKGGKNSLWRFTHRAQLHGVATMHLARPANIEVLRPKPRITPPPPMMRGVSLELLAVDDNLASDAELTLPPRLPEPERSQKYANLSPEQRQLLEELHDESNW